MKELIESRLSVLKAKSFAELEVLSTHQSEKIKLGNKTIVISVWVDKLSEREVQVVVQAYKPWFLGIGKMNAQGFRLSDSGELKMLGEEELYEFL